MNISALELGQLLKGEIVGDNQVLVNAPAKIEDANPGTITFLGNMKYEPFLYNTNASIVLVPHDFEPSEPTEMTLIKVKDVYEAIGTLMNTFVESKDEPYVRSKNSVIDETANLDDHVSVGHFTVIQSGVEIKQQTRIHDQVFIGENSKIGKNCIIYPGVKIYSNTIIGDRCIIHSGTVIGCDGFGYSRSEDGKYTKINHLGHVILEDDVELGANMVVDRATMGVTLIKRGAKLDNLIQVAHNVEIGEDTAIAAQAGIAGSTKIGDRVLIGGQAGLAGHRTIADEVEIQAQSGVSGNVTEVGKRLYGTPAFEYNKYLKSYALMKNLPEMRNQIRAMVKELESIKNNKQ